MKQYLLILVISFIFIGCAQQQSVYMQAPSEKYTQEMRFDHAPVTQKPFSFLDSKQRVAIVFPSKVVGKYATGAINTTISYMLYQNKEFALDVIDSYDEDKASIKAAMASLFEKKYKKVILLFTEDSLPFLNQMSGLDNLTIYMPLINIKESALQYSNITYGGIDYERQMEKLLTLSNGKNAIFYEDSLLGDKLKEIILQQHSNIILNTKIDRVRNDYKTIVTNPKIEDATLFLHTTIIKSSILLSQLRAQEATPYVILSTQLNYTPLIVSLTQYLDRKDFIVANSIEKTKPKLEELITLLDSDIVYNWVNYSTLIGINYLYENQKSDLISNPIRANQVQFNTTLLKNTPYGFKKYNTN
ncbi:MAG: hypothetical protein ACNI3C_12635 [Candidatus Marinarcus sp.]|uniref:hypothetical protein n=1 Tax=Candidatus Marinarcus sp. TaxID=3100987 RepID=UPI003AFFA461